MATINTAQLKITLAKDSTGKLKALATSRAKDIFQDNVEQLKEDFEEHKVTLELDGGNAAANLSNTLVGGEVRPTKNLYSFIGFPNGDKPTDAIRERLDPSHPDGPKIEYVDRSATEPVYRFKVRQPNKSGIYRATPIPWAKGMSWAQKIESYIPGFAFFLAKEFPDPPSRSEGGIQTKHEVRNAEFKPPAEGYLSKLFSNFLDNIKSVSKTGGRRRDSSGRFQSFDQ